MGSKDTLPCAVSLLYLYGLIPEISLLETLDVKRSFVLPSDHLYHYATAELYRLTCLLFILQLTHANDSASQPLNKQHGLISVYFGDSGSVGACIFV